MSLTNAIATASADDIIFLKAGTYTPTANIAISKPLVIRGGFAGTDNTTLDPDSPVSVFDANNAAAVTAIFNVTTATGVNRVNVFERIEVKNGYERGFLKTGSGSLVFRNCAFTSCGTTRASNYNGRGGSFTGTAQATLAFENCTFARNAFSASAQQLGYGFGAYIATWKQVYIDNPLFVSNGLSSACVYGGYNGSGRDGNAGAAFYATAAPMTIRNSDFRANLAGTSGATRGNIAYLAGNCNSSAAAMERLADHYGIPSICLGPRIARMIAQDKLVMSLSELTPGLAKDDPHYERKLKKALSENRRLLFSRDGVHPTDIGHDLILSAVTTGLVQLWNSVPTNRAARFIKPFSENSLEAAKMIDVKAEMLSGAWRRLASTDDKAKAFTPKMGEIWYAREPGDTLSFKFKGSCCKIYDLMGPDGGQLWITVDGKRTRRPVPRFDSLCTQHRIAVLNIYDGEPGTHEVTLEVDKNEPSRTSVAFRLQNPDAELCSPKYRGTKFWPAKILLVGDMLM